MKMGERKDTVKISVNPDTESSGFGYVEPGPYRLRVVKLEQRKGKKAAYLNWELEFVDQNVKSTDGKSTPGHIFENTTLSTEKNAQFMLRNMVEGLRLSWADFDTESAIGLEMDVQLKVREYEGKFSNEIGRVIPPKK